MLKSYLKIALRSLKRHKVFSIINVLGLSVGLACCMLIGLYISEETSYDKFHTNSDNIYRFTREFISPDGSTSLHLSRLAPPFGPLAKEDFSGEIEKIGRMMSVGGPVKYNNRLYDEDNFYFADAEIAEILTFDVIEGDIVQALTQPGSVVISDEMAYKYFGDEDPIGKSINFLSQADLIVKGVFKKLPENSSFQVDFLAEMTPLEAFYGGREAMMQNWGSNNFSTFFTLKPEGRISEIERRLGDFLNKHIDEEATTWTALHVQKLTDIHLHSNLDDEQGQNSDITYVYIFASIAFLILAIACINYMNLATARSATRAKEVGMRKVFGAGKGKLINQFLVESIVLVFFALFLAVGATSLILPYFRAFTGLQLEFDLLTNLPMVAVILTSAVVVGVLSGSYPAFYLSSFQPLKVLKGKLTGGAKSGNLRRFLVVVQFTISVILIVSTIVVFKQLDFIQNKKLGYDREQMMILGVSQQVADQYDAFKNELLTIQGVKMVGGSSRVPSGQLLDSQGAQAEVNGEMLPTPVVIKSLSVDPDFIPTYQMEMASGRNFSDNFATDSTSFVLNEKSVEVIGWGNTEDAIGQNMIYAGVRGKVIGVVKDFHFESLQSEISPIIMVNRPNQMRNLSIKIEGTNIRSAIQQVEELYANFSPNAPLNYNFLDDRFENLYTTETQRSQLFTLFSGLAIFLACLGLFGLASFTVSQRSKEISIRKVLGASVQQIVGILSKEFVILIAVAMLLAFPVAWYFMNDWLAGYAYRTTLGVSPFLLAALIAGAIAFVTISFQTFKAAVSNPSERLRDE
ncbi:ABC transporter permease [Roseivirga seohaensis]|uniref:ABC transporter permease n=1 Tax=Roseivirga seohaensis TaxID=1914963 RepID=UPI003BAD968B